MAGAVGSRREPDRTYTLYLDAGEGVCTVTMRALPREGDVRHTYTVVLDPDLEEGGYTVTVPALPGVVTQGETAEQCMERAREAIALHLAAMAEDGDRIPEAEY